MNYKHLGKYHYIYRLSFGGDTRIHIEKLPIAYSNQHYVYAIEPGVYELTKLTLRPFAFYDHGDIYTDTSEKTEEKIVTYLSSVAKDGYKCFNRKFYFLIDDPAELDALGERIGRVNLLRAWLTSEAVRIQNTIESQEKETQKWRSKLANLNYRIHKIDFPDE